MWSLRFLLTVGLLGICLPTRGHAQGPLRPGPVLRLEGIGPTAQVNALAFSPDGKTLYSAGYDKLIRVWKLDPAMRRFVSAPTSFRLPMGPGMAGVINALAVSPDGRWLAAAGLGMVRDEAGFADEESGIHRISQDASLLDQGIITLFDTRDPLPPGEPPLRWLSGHRGAVEALSFAPGIVGAPPVLISAGRESGPVVGQKQGQICTWNIDHSLSRNVDGKISGNIKEALLGELPLENPHPELLPTLATHRTGKGLKDIRVALTWYNTTLGTWDLVKFSPLPQKKQSGIYTTVTYLPNGSLAAGSSGSPHFHLWDSALTEVPTQGNLVPKFIPTALAPLPDRPGILPSVAIILRQTLGRPEEKRWSFSVQVYTVPGLTPVWGKSLWNPITSNPVMAVAQDGSYLAVSGDGTDSIHVYRIQDLQEGRREPSYQALQGSPWKTPVLSFLTRRDSLGLRLSTQTGVEFGPDDLVFDCTQPGVATLSASPGWVPIAKEDPVQWVEKNRQIRFQGRTVSVPLKPTEEVTSLVMVRNPVGTTTGPLLVVASWDHRLGVSRLTVFRTDNPAAIRELKGHTQRIRSLAVSPDGRLLASSAEDQTVSLWSLVDFSKIVDRAGALPGVTLQQKGGVLLVSQVDSSGHPDGIRVGDVITRVDLPDRAPLLNPAALEVCEALWEYPPGQRVHVTVQRDKELQKIPVTLGQAVDGRKPLCWLHVIPEPREAKAQPDWIVWSPAGPYDSRGRKIQDVVGWHFNPARQGERTEYRELATLEKSYRRPQLFGPLLRHGSFAKAWGEINDPKKIPGARLRWDSIGGMRRVDRHGHYLIRSPRVRVAFRLVSPEPEQVESIVLRLGKTEVRFDPIHAGGSDYETEVFLPGPGIHDGRLEMRTLNPEAAPRIETFTVRYQLPPPTLDIINPQQTKTIKGDTLSLEARVTTQDGVKGTKVGVDYQGKSVDLRLADNRRVRHDLPLKPGMNEVILWAMNQEALPGYEEDETTKRTLLLERSHPAPQVAFVQVEVDPNTPSASILPIRPSELLITDSPKIRVKGKVTWPAEATETDVSVELKSTTGSVIPLTPKREGNAAVVEQNLELPPGGEQTWTLFARPKKGDVGVSPPLRVVYRPALPTFRLTRPSIDATTLKEGRDRLVLAEVDLEGVFTPARVFAPFDISIRVLGPEGAKQSQTQRMSTSAECFPDDGSPVRLGKIRLERGESRIEVRLRNEFRGEGPPEIRVMTYHRPPYFVSKLTAITPVDRPVTQVTATVQFPEDAPLTKILVNRQNYSMEDNFHRESRANGLITGRIEVKDIPLPIRGGTIPVVLEIANADGTAIASADVHVKSAPAPKPIISVNLPEGPRRRLQGEGEEPLKVSKSPLSGTVTVQALAPLHRLKISLDGKQLPVGNFDHNSAKTVPLDIPLREGIQRLDVEAATADSFARGSLFIIYAPPPEVEIKLEPFADSFIQPDPVLKGRIALRPGVDPAVAERAFKELQIYVNDYKQPLPRKQWAKDKSSLEFSVDLLLNRTINRIDLECPVVRASDGGKREFLVGCQKPHTERNLHLLIVHPDGSPATRKELAQRAMAALQLSPPLMKSGAFDRVIPHPGPKVIPLVGSLLPGDVRSILEDITEEIKMEGSAADVVLIYWLGQEEASPEGSALLLRTTHSQKGHPPGPDTHIDVRELLAVREPSLGARVLLLDSSPGAAEVMRAFPWEGSHAAILRCAWSNGKGPKTGVLLSILEEAGRRRPREVRLQDAAKVAQTLSNQPQYRDSLQEFTPYYSSLADLLLARPNLP